MSNSISSDKVLVVGGTGFIGKHLIKRCLKETPFVTCIGCSGIGNEKIFVQDIEILQADITDKKQLQSTLSDKTFDYVFNLGGYINHTPYFMGGRQVIDAHFIFLINLFYFFFYVWL